MYNDKAMIVSAMSVSTTAAPDILRTPHLRAQVYLYLLRSISISISNSAAFSLPSLCACSHRLLQIKALLVEHDIKVDAQDKVKGL